MISGDLFVQLREKGMWLITFKGMNSIVGVGVEVEVDDESIVII